MASIRVLYVDDEPAMQSLVKTFLERSGEIEVDTVSSVQEAEKALSDGRFDAVISDYQMPQRDGLEFLKDLRAADNQIPFILFTGRGREEVVIEALNSGADFYMQKGGKPQTQFAELEHYVVQGVQRHRAEHAHLVSEGHFRSLVQNSFEGIGIHIDGVMVEMNKAFCDISGYTGGEIIGMPVKDLFTPETWEVMREKLKLPYADAYDVQLVRRDGTVIACQTRGKNILWNGQVARLGTILDITERKKMEEKLRENESRFRNLIETSPDVIWEIDGNGTFTYLSPRIHGLTGYAPEELIGRSMLSLTTPGSTDVARRRLMEHLERPGQFTTLEVTLARRGGDLRDIEINSVPVLDSNGRVTGFRGNARDITERIRSEKAEKNSNTLLSAMLESSPDVIVFALDNEYRYLAFNRLHQQTMRAIWGKEISVGMNMLDVIGTEEDRRKAKDNFDQALSGKSFSFTEEFGDEALNRWTWQDYYSPIISEGKVVGLTVYCLNVTEREMVKLDLQDANNKLRIISSITRHDVLNKLMALHGYLELEKRRATDLKSLEHIGKMTQITRDLENQINFTKEYQDIGQFKPTWHSLSEVCAQAQAELDHCRAEVVIETDGLELFADPMLKKVFHNLMDNSMRHGLSVKRIQIGFRGSDGEVRVIYQDDGVGITGTDRERLFIKGSGNSSHGLGLFLAKEILKITDITIREVGEAGGGARFEIKVPPGKFRFREKAPTGP